MHGRTDTDSVTKQEEVVDVLPFDFVSAIIHENCLVTSGEKSLAALGRPKKKPTSRNRKASFMSTNVTNPYPFESITQVSFGVPLRVGTG